MVPSYIDLSVDKQNSICDCAANIPVLGLIVSKLVVEVHKIKICTK